LQTNVHFPTDLNLLWDALRKCLDAVKIIQSQDYGVKGWRKIKELRKRVKSQYRSTSQQVFKGKNIENKIASVKAYLEIARQLHNRFSDVKTDVDSILALHHFNSYVGKFIDQIDRRILQGQLIPSEEKVYSIFEPHTEWLNKGKSNPSVELGLNVLITTDQNHLIVDYKVLEKQQDVVQIEPLCKRLKKLYPETKIKSHSVDKGFYSKNNKEIMETLVENVVMPKKGKLNKLEALQEGSEEFKKIRNAHSAVESNINMLEHHGLNRCPDKGLNGLKRYVGLSVLAYNLHIIGNHLIAKERLKQKKKFQKFNRLLMRAA